MWHTLTKSLCFKHTSLIELPWRRRSAGNDRRHTYRCRGDNKSTINRSHMQKKVFQSELSGVELQVNWAFHGKVLPLQGCPSSSGVSLKLYNLTAWVWEWARIMHFSSCTMLWKNKTNWVIFNLICQAAVLNHPSHDDCKHCFRSSFSIVFLDKTSKLQPSHFTCRQVTLHVDIHAICGL